MQHQDRSQSGVSLAELCSVVALVVIAGCGKGIGPDRVFHAPDAGHSVDQSTATFESDDPNYGIQGSGSAEPGPPPPEADPDTQDSSDDASGTIREADLIRVEGDRLYALSEYSGLAVIDLSVPESLRMLGHRVMKARPFDIFVRSGIAYAIYSSFPKWEARPDGSWESHATSRLVAFDVRDPTALVELGSLDIPGVVTDSRIVGEVAYVVAYEDGSCWGCAEGQPRTTVSSIAIGSPASLQQVDQLGFDDQKSAFVRYRRVVSLHAQRIYVSGMVFDWAWGAGTGYSTVQILDISNGSGRLALGANVAATGKIENAWQLDEFDGVLRTVTQAGSGWSDGPPPTFETFAATDSQASSPLGKLELSAPTDDAQQRALHSVRFDGTRGYAIAAEHGDRVYTIDFADPANPRQAVSLPVQGYVHQIESEGARLIALSTLDAVTSRDVTVSMFDVSNLDEPSLRSVAIVRNAWGPDSAGRTSIRKTAEIFQDAALISVPFATYANSKPDGGSCAVHLSGFQLLDFNPDGVGLRGVVPIRGDVKQTFVHRGNLVAMTDDQVASFDITNRDSPRRLSQVAIANTAQQAVRVGANIVALGSDWYTQSPQIVVFPTERGASVPIASLDLGGAIAASSSDCWESYWASFSGSSQLLVNGNLVYMVYDARFARQQGQVGFAVVDVNDPAHPVLAGHKVLTLGATISSGPDHDSENSQSYGCGVGHYDSPNGFYPAGQRIVHVGSTVMLQELLKTPSRKTGSLDSSQARAALHAVDLSNPTDIHLLSSTVISEGSPTSGLFASRNNVMTSHLETAGTTGKVRFYLDRLDLTNPLSPTRSKINVPGSLFGVDDESNRVVTIDYVRTVEAANRTGTAGAWSCGQTSFGTSWIAHKEDSSEDEPQADSEGCVRLDRVLTLVDLAAGVTTVLDTYWPEGEPILDAAMGVDRIYLTHDTGGTQPSSRTVEVVAGIRSGDLASTTLIDIPSRQYPVPSSSNAWFAIPPSDSSPLLVYDTTNPAAPTKILESDGTTNPYSWVYSATLDSEYVILAMGQYGVAAIPVR